MDVSRIRALRGLTSGVATAIQAIVTCTPDECDLAKLPDFEKRLRALFPSMGPCALMGVRARLVWRTRSKPWPWPCRRKPVAR